MIGTPFFSYRFISIQAIPVLPSLVTIYMPTSFYDLSFQLPPSSLSNSRYPDFHNLFYNERSLMIRSLPSLYLLGIAFVVLLSYTSADPRWSRAKEGAPSVLHGHGGITSIIRLHSPGAFY